MVVGSTWRYAHDTASTSSGAWWPFSVLPRYLAEARLGLFIRQDTLFCVLPCAIAMSAFDGISQLSNSSSCFQTTSRVIRSELSLRSSGWNRRCSAAAERVRVESLERTTLVVTLRNYIFASWETDAVRVGAAGSLTICPKWNLVCFREALQKNTFSHLSYRMMLVSLLLAILGV